MQGEQIDYLVDCVFNPESQRLFLIGGAFAGSLAVMHVNIVGASGVCYSPRVQGAIEPVLSMHGGHADTVRCVSWNTAVRLPRAKYRNHLRRAAIWCPVMSRPCSRAGRHTSTPRRCVHGEFAGPAAITFLFRAGDGAAADHAREADFGTPAQRQAVLASLLGIKSQQRHLLLGHQLAAMHVAELKSRIRRAHRSMRHLR